MIELVLNLSVLCFVMKSYKTYVSVIYVINEERFFSKAKKEDLVPMDEIISTLRYYIITLRINWSVPNRDSLQKTYQKHCIILQAI